MERSQASVNVARNLDRRGLLHVARRVSVETGVPIDVFLGRARCRSVMNARRALYLRHEGLSLPEIGSLLDRDHTTILCGLRPIGARKQGIAPTTVFLKVAL